MFKVAVLVGSLRRESINRKFARALAKLAQDKLDFRFVDLAEVPIYNEDLLADMPAAVQRLKADVEAADAVLFVTPEYNRSIPGLVKNAIDWGTRPYGKNSWAGKPGSIVGTSPGATGTAVAQSHLRSVLVSCGVRLLGQPEVYVVNKAGLIADDFEVTDAKSREFLSGYLSTFDAWIADTVKRG